ncbi:MAG: O-antigen ligase family protein [Candidatus Sabulitectum sp.]|nr:O-antigen ligase family protein [Candidatus Sabulitectum sp.]
MAGFLLFFLPFTITLAAVIPGLFDSTMMSRLAMYPLAGSVIFFFGRKSISTTHLIIGSLIGLLPALSLLWGTSATGGIPYAVRWFSFGMMITGFSGTIARWGLRVHLKALAASAVLVSAVMLSAGADTITGNANRAGMVLSLGFVGSLVFFKKDKWYSWVLTTIILAGVYISSFYIGWVACLVGALVFYSWKKIKPWMILVIMISGQIFSMFFPEAAGRIGPTLELRTRIWRNSAELFLDNLPLGTGTGSARLEIFNSSEPELRELSGGDKRIDYLHSEPLTIITETGIPGLLLLLFMLYWLSRRSRSDYQLASLAVFWLIFTSDLPLATPLGAIPAALFLSSVGGLSNRKLNVPAAVPALALFFSLFWCFTVITGYLALGRTGTDQLGDLELAARRIPWEERVFLASGQAHLKNNMILAALEDSEKFINLYPEYYRGWELRAAALSAAGRDSYSAWAKATLLIPENIHLQDRYLFALNSIQIEGMNPDTAMAISSVITNSQENLSVTISSLPQAGLIHASELCLRLSIQCRSVSMEEAASIWHISARFAASAETSVTAELASSILAEADLHQYLTRPKQEEIEKILGLLRAEPGMEPVQTPPP